MPVKLCFVFFFLNINHIFLPNIIVYSSLIHIHCSQTSLIYCFPFPIKLLICNAALSPNILEEIKGLTFANRIPIYF